MKVKKVVIAAYLLLVAALLVALLYNNQPKEPPALQRLRDYCMTVSVAFDRGAKELASGDPVVQAKAADRLFTNFATYHSEQEVLLCADIVPDLRDRDRCWLARDYPCLEAMARATAQATRPK